MALFNQPTQVDESTQILRTMEPVLPTGLPADGLPERTESAITAVAGAADASGDTTYAIGNAMASDVGDGVGYDIGNDIGNDVRSSGEPFAAVRAQDPDLLPDSDQNAQSASVWIPFHSEASARGFARRLSQELAYPFEVQRLGPGAYQVVLAGAPADEIAGLEARIAEVTGG